MAGGGAQAVRVGKPATMREDLQRYSLDARVRQTAQYRQVRGFPAAGLLL